MSEPTISDEQIRSTAERIFEDIENNRIELPDGTCGWIGYSSTKGELSLKNLKGLYSGHLGIALYFGAMYSVLRDDVYRRAAYDAVKHLCEEDVAELTDDVGAGVGSGFGAFTYGLSVLSELTDDRQYEDRAERFARALTDEQITDDEYDLLLGTAGTMTGLLGLYERTNVPVALDKAVECGEHLLNSRYDKWGREVWNTHWAENVRSFSTGMGHGATGICYSLYRLYDHTGRDEFRDAADDALGFEEIFYSEYENNWRANWTHMPHYPDWWCYGLAGIGLGRIGSLNYHQSDRLERDLDRARKGLEPRLVPSDEVCHGTFSQVEFLVELDREFENDYGERARELAEMAIERKQLNGGFQVPYSDVDGIYNPVFFLGTAGIGYTLLRLLRPDDIPSVLRFE